MSDTLKSTTTAHPTSEERTPGDSPNLHPDPGDTVGLNGPVGLSDISGLQLQCVFDASPDAIVCIDRNWTCTLFNPAARDIFQADDLLGANLWTRFPLNQQEPFASNYRTCMDERISTEFETFCPEPLNLWLRVLARPCEEGIIIFSRDISDRKHAETIRNNAARQLEQVFEATTDGVLSLDRNWNFTFLNSHALSILQPRKDLIGKNLWEEFPAALDSQFYSKYHQTMDLRTPSDFEEFYPAPLNLWFSVQCRPSDDGIVVFFRNGTAERAATQVLLDHQATLSFVKQTARVATWVLDFATGALCFGDDSFPVFGRPLSQITTRQDFRNLVLPEDRPRVEARTRKAIETGAAAAVDYRVTAPDGSILWLEGRGVPVYDDHGAATHLRGMTTDITARKRNEENLISSEARYRVLTDLNPQAIWMGTPDGRVTYTNQGFLDYTGFTLDQLTGDNYIRAFDAADRDRVAAAWMRSVATGDAYEVEAHMIRHADGASRWWMVRGMPVRDDSGAILYWLGVASDIHDSKIVAEELRLKQEETERQRAELETIYETAPLGLALFDPVDFRWLRLNESQAQIMGRTKEELLNTRLFDVVSIDGVRELLGRAAAGTPVRDHILEGELPTLPGEKRIWNVSYVPVFGEDGSVQAIAASTLEITRQKQSELALIQSEKLAAVGRLASSISHEINNPLEAITNLLFLVAMDEDLPDSVKSYVHMAQSELSRVSQIATQTLRFHRQAVRPTLVNAADLVNAVLNLYQGRLNNSGIQVEARYDSRTPILCFENDIRQVLNNLISNALDAMRTGGHLLVRAHDVTDGVETPGSSAPRRGVRITIADTGHGMSPATRARIFEPFYTTKELSGTGLGLWISIGIVQHHHGRLAVRSSKHLLHHGTIFTLFLPCTAQ